jgi:beta-lactam-binding protein with PASTA domain
LLKTLQQALSMIKLQSKSDISKGVEVPNVVGQSKENAISTLTNQGFKVEVVPDDQAIRQCN